MSCGAAGAGPDCSRPRARHPSIDRLERICSRRSWPAVGTWAGGIPDCVRDSVTWFAGAGTGPGAANVLPAVVRRQDPAYGRPGLHTPCRTRRLITLSLRAGFSGHDRRMPAAVPPRAFTASRQRPSCTLRSHRICRSPSRFARLGQSLKPVSAIWQRLPGSTRMVARCVAFKGRGKTGRLRGRHLSKHQGAMALERLSSVAFIRMNLQWCLASPCMPTLGVFMHGTAAKTPDQSGLQPKGTWHEITFGDDRQRLGIECDSHRG